MSQHISFPNIFQQGQAGTETPRNPRPLGLPGGIEESLSIPHEVEHVQA